VEENDIYVHSGNSPSSLDRKAVNCSLSSSGMDIDYINIISTCMAFLRSILTREKPKPKYT
jgi:hypothetical protein